MLVWIGTDLLLVAAGTGKIDEFFMNYRRD